MIYSPASGVESLLGGISHPEKFFVNLLEVTTIPGIFGLGKKTSFGILLSIFCHFSGHPKSKINSKITLIVLSKFIVR